ncbi:MAG: TetR family transcriptional regulator C-terminal domain-containing protein [Clostridiales bacterium]|nr:TetR family transcriptional regulator C-terminal domain-containing protein [Clostridiales bacterium]
MDDKKKTDRRVLYTKMFLKESLLELMKEKPVDKITPTELCRKANINRNTFYTHYYTVRDVLAEVESDFSAQIIESLSSKFTAADIDISQMLKEICHIIYAQKDFCKVLLSENGDASFFETVISTGKPVVIMGWRSEGIELDDNEMEMFFSFIVNGSIALIRKWAASDMYESPEKVAALIERIAYTGINGMKQIK